MFSPCWSRLLLAAVLMARALADGFPEPVDSEKSPTRPMSPSEAASGWKLPPGFSMSVFAAEPDVRQPIGMAFDPRGRLWVAENYTYAEAGVLFATNYNDRVLVLEDTDGDGKFDSRKVFIDSVKILTSVETGLGGVWLMCPPRLLFVPDRNGDDVPDGPPEVVLDGFDTTTGSHHTFANGLRWGPDGWLWGRVGISSPTRVGRPGDPESRRTVMGGGIWRYNPRTKAVESVAHGTTNPWGNDWNAEGEPFFINTVIGHLWHAIPGAHFRRMYGDDPTPFVYSLIEQHADHFHFDTGAGWTKSRAGQADGSVSPDSDALGGGHAHSGLMIYQGGNWPADYEGALFTVNLHGRRLNRERLERGGSGYVGRHAADFGFSPDPWFRGLDLIQGPDGAAYISDWSDTGECHDHDGVSRSSGRIYRLNYAAGKPPGPRGIAAGTTDADLVAYQFGASEWHRRQARGLLRDRASAGRLDSKVTEVLRKRIASGQNRLETLRALWALIAVDGTTPDLLLGLLRSPDEHLRSWAVRLLSDQPVAPSPAATAAFVEIAPKESSALVRLYLASALRRLPVGERAGLATALLSHAEDDADHNQGPMIWFALEPLVAARPEVAVELAVGSRIHGVRQNIARRLSENIQTGPESVGGLVRDITSAPADVQVDVLRGLADALRGVRKTRAPSSWTESAAAFAKSGSAEVRERARQLSVVFGDGLALDDLKKVFADAKADGESRRTALRALLESRPEGLAAFLVTNVNDATVSGPVLAGLIALGEPSAPGLAVGKYPWLSPADRSLVVGAAVTRASAAKAFLNAIAAGRIPRDALNPTHARQIAGLGDAAVGAQLAEVWGVAGGGDADKRKAIATLRAELAPAAASADLAAGRVQFQRLCSGCHVLYGEGGQVGPDLTGSGRASLDYLLENVVDPGAVVAADYRMTVVELKDGRTLNGLLREANPRTVTLMMPGERTTLERSEITRLETTSSSMMSEGLLESLKPEERRNLVGYLMHPRQVELPK